MSESVSVIIPTYSGAASLPELIDRLTRVLSSRETEFEILIIEDASPDSGKTWSVVKKLALEFPHVKGYRLLRNRGQHNALLLGIRNARYSTIVTLDDDLQNPPEELVSLLDKLSSDGADVVYGVPRKKEHGFFQNLGSNFVRFVLSQGLGAAHARHVTSYRAFKTGLRDSFATHESPRVNIDALLGWGATRYSIVSVDHRPRAEGRSGYSFGKLVGHALSMMTSYSTTPLRVASSLGFIFMFFGVSALVYVISGKLLGFVTEPGFTFIVSFISIISGAQLLSLGVIGEYLATVFMRSMGMPSYTLAEETSGEHDHINRSKDDLRDP